MNETAADWVQSSQGVTDLGLERILEAVLLAARGPLNLDQLQALFDPEERPERREIKQALEALQQAALGSSQELKEVAGGYRYQIKADYAPWVSRLWESKPPRYSRALLETLALIAYRQPVTRGEIEEVRGVSVSSQIIRTLEERDWIRVIGHREVPGRPALYATTRHFLDYFNLTSLTELPELDELRALAELETEQWQDELDQAPVSPLLLEEASDTAMDAEGNEAAAASPVASEAAPSTASRELTFADLAARLSDPSTSG
ncbi:SMC-Scp complex subunit ScpB [Marinospirillum sp. MEB164]|uniref:SMC-Scp complex subunit ScpB n=1 Tax=Marinospirillum alkalitolerans TaxID=3123374 RepID=A0ABW8PTL0_9GAMM